MIRRASIGIALAMALASCVGSAGATGTAAAPAGGGAGARRAVVLFSPAGYRLPVGRIEFGAVETAACFRCHGMPNFMVRDSVTLAVRHLSVDSAAHARSAHRRQACTDCHPEVRAYPHEFKVARARVGCDADCHARDAQGQPVRHTAQLADFRRSAHAKGWTGEDPASPTCTYCHGRGDPHAIAPAKQALSRAAKMELCAPCHDDRERMTASEVDPDAVASYRRSFHYKAIRFGSTKAAVCQDCHGVHRVVAPDDTSSTVSAVHLPQTCGQKDCHAGARVPFALSGANHLELRARREPVLRAAERFFLWGGGAVLLLLATGVVLDAQRRFLPFATAARGNPGGNPGTNPRGNPGSHAGSAAAREPLVPRLSLAQRLQHAGLVASFTALAITGIPLRFPDSEPVAAFYRLLGGLTVARAVHRAAAVVMILVAVAHVVYAIALLARSGFDPRRAWTMLPGARDLRDGWNATLHHLRRRARPPALPRHHFREKLHYLAVLWGVPVMTLSGLVLWFPLHFGNRLPDVALGVAFFAHSDEALFAVAVVVVWHLYNVHVVPGPHHRFRTWIDGRITRGEWIEQHGGEAEAALAGGQAPPGGGVPGEDRHGRGAQTS